MNSEKQLVKWTEQLAELEKKFSNRFMQDSTSAAFTSRLLFKQVDSGTNIFHLDNKDGQFLNCVNVQEQESETDKILTKAISASEAT